MFTWVAASVLVVGGTIGLIGYKPWRLDQLQRASTVLELREQLRRAIELEQFEQAARLRDQLKEVAE